MTDIRIRITIGYLLEIHLIHWLRRNTVPLSSSLEIETLCSSETLMSTYRPTRQHYPEGQHGRHWSGLADIDSGSLEKWNFVGQRHYSALATSGKLKLCAIYILCAVGSPNLANSKFSSIAPITNFAAILPIVFLKIPHSLSRYNIHKGGGSILSALRHAQTYLRNTMGDKWLNLMRSLDFEIEWLL